MNFETYRIFYYTARYKNITGAAKALFLTQPTVSHAIAGLEKELGCRFSSAPKREFRWHRRQSFCIVIYRKHSSMWKTENSPCAITCPCPKGRSARRQRDHPALFSSSLFRTVSCRLSPYPAENLQYHHSGGTSRIKGARHWFCSDHRTSSGWVHWNPRIIGNQGYFHRRSPIFPVKRHTASSVRSKRLPYRFHGTRYRNQGTSGAHICQLWLSPHTRYRAGHYRPDHPHGLSQPWNRVCTLFFRGKQPDQWLCLSAEYRRSDSQTLHLHCCKQRISIICGSRENGGAAGVT